MSLLHYLRVLILTACALVAYYVLTTWPSANAQRWYLANTYRTATAYEVIYGWYPNPAMSVSRPVDAPFISVGPPQAVTSSNYIYRDAQGNLVIVRHLEKHK